MHLGSGERCSAAADLSPDLVQPLSPPARGLRSREPCGGWTVKARLGPLCGLSGRVVGPLGRGAPLGLSPAPCVVAGYGSQAVPG